LHCNDSWQKKSPGHVQTWIELGTLTGNNTH
jgi:hypothetical protein